MSKVKYTKEILESHIKNADSWAGVCRSLGVKPFTGAQTHIKKKAREFGIDTKHFLGQVWSRDKKALNFVETSVYLRNEKPIKSHTLKLRLIKEGLKKECCERCGISEWYGSYVPLELDHINSDHFDNRLENLQIICPNCHAQLTRERNLPS